MVCVVLMANPSRSPVASLNWRTLTTNRVPSVNTWSSGPITKRISPFRTNMTPTEATIWMTGAAFLRR